MIHAVLIAFFFFQTQSASEAKNGRGQVVARVGTKNITLADIDLQLGRSGAADGALKDLPIAVRLSTIHLIALQIQSLETLTKAKAVISAADVDRWLVETYATEDKQTGEQIARAKAQAAGTSEAAFRELIQWRLSWQKYLDQHLTAANLKKQFQNQPARFDGTKFLVEHLLIETLPGPSEQRTAASQQMNQLRAQLVKGELKWEQAASRLNADKSTLAKFEPIWISGNGPLHPAVVDATVKLKANEVSSVFDSPAGVHLVKLLSKEPGSKQMEEANDDVRRYMLMYLLEYSAKQSSEQMPLTVLPAAILAK